MEIYIYYILSGIYLLFIFIVLFISRKRRINFYLLALICLLLTPVTGLILLFYSSKKGLIIHYKIDTNNSKLRNQENSPPSLNIINQYFS